MFLLELLENHGVRFVLGSTIVLVFGAAVVLLSRAPVKAQRIGELTILLALVWPLVSLIPVPRSGLPGPIAPRPAATARQPIEQTAPPTPSLPLELSIETSTSTPANSYTQPTDSSASPSFLAPVFLLGAAARSAWLLFGVACLVVLIRRSTPAPKSIRKLAAGVDRRLARIPIRISRSTARPFCAPFPRPVIILPAELCQDDRDEALRAILLHELAHVRRRDLLGEALFALASPLFFWNPVFWWLHRRARQSAELLADQMAVSEMDKASYVRALVGLAENTVRPANAIVGALFAIELENDFYRRIRMLVRRKTALETHCSRTHTLVRHGAALALLAALGLSLGAPVATASAPMDVEQRPAAKDLVEKSYTMKISYTGKEALGNLITHLVQNGQAVEVLSISQPAASGGSWSCELGTESSSDTFAQELAGLIDGVEGSEIFQLRRITAPTAPGITDGPTVTLTAADKQFSEFAQEIAALAKANIVIAPEVQGSVTMAFYETPWRAALEAVAGSLGYVLTDQPGGVVVIAAPR